MISKVGVSLCCSVAMMTSLAVAFTGSRVDANPLLDIESSESVESGSIISAVVENPAQTVSDEALARFNLLRQGDQLYLSGSRDQAAVLYQQAKRLDDQSVAVAQLPEPTFDVENGAVKVYWREGNQGFEKDLESKIIVPLTLLTQNHPEFIPGHLRLAEGHNKYDRPEEALAALERGASIYSSVIELQEALMNQQVEMKLWLPASITARQFATLNPEHERAAEFMEKSAIYQRRFRNTVRENLASNTVGSFLTGALELGLTGNPFGAISPIQNTIALLRGEESVGRSAAKSFRKKLPIIEDPELTEYVNRIGHKLAAVSGRDLEYEFFVVNDDRVNAFGLPGGKVFVNSGAILKSRSEAELAGLLAHELSHAVLSHSFQTYTQSNATGGFSELIPFSGLFSSVAVTKYSRELEQQADVLGTRILVKAGYAADGLENLSREIMQNPPEKKKGSWFARHPDLENQIQALSQLIERNGYDRYGFEGIEEHTQMQKIALGAQEQLQRELAEQKQAKKSKTQRQNDEI